VSARGVSAFVAPGAVGLVGFGFALEGHHRSLHSLVMHFVSDFKRAGVGFWANAHTPTRPTPPPPPRDTPGGAVMGGGKQGAPVRTEPHRGNVSAYRRLGVSAYLWGFNLQGEAAREAPVRTEPHPTNPRDPALCCNPL
jgi:hypothetical protein